MNDKRDAIIRMRNKIRALISATGPESELVQALHHSEHQNPCDQIVGKLLTERVRRASQAAQRAASAAARKHRRGVMTDNSEFHKLARRLLSCISLLLQEANLPPDDTDFASKTRFSSIYNIAWYADAFVDIALEAWTLAEATASTAASAHRNNTVIEFKRPAEALVD